MYIITKQNEIRKRKLKISLFVLALLFGMGC